MKFAKLAVVAALVVATTSASAFSFKSLLRPRLPFRYAVASIVTVPVVGPLVLAPVRSMTDKNGMPWIFKELNDDYDDHRIRPAPPPFPVYGGPCSAGGVSPC